MSTKRNAFTLAEILITLGIIGVVAALTIPGLLKECHWIIVKNAFKKQYSTLYQALKTVEYNLDYTPNCYYWTSNPYGVAKCTTYDSNGTCTKYALTSSGESLPSDYNGRFTECTLVKNEIKRILKVAQICSNKALEKGCIPAYKGYDTVIKTSYPDKSDYDINKSTTGCSSWRETNIHNSCEAWVLMDGTIILFYSGFQLFAVDVNGKKGPNKWGYDLFALQTKSNGELPLQLAAGFCYSPEKGGLSTNNLMKNLFNK
jgi:prepilin-type N-terminal cleavage/methylation domain-containing protein